MTSIGYIGILFVLTIIIVNIHGDSVVSHIKRSNPCPVNQEYNKCGSACPPSCSDLFYPKEKKICTAQCVRDCFCKSGFYRSKTGTCVKPSQCCQGQNEKYASCGTACPETCDYQPGACTRICVLGCFCKTGYIRTDNSTNSPCITKAQC